METQRLRWSAKRYEAWLKACRTEFRRRRSLPSGWLSLRLEQALESGEMASVLDNAKLTHFVKRLVRDGALLDHETLRLEDP